MSDVYIVILVTLVVLILTYLFSRKFRKSANVVLLTGLSDSGKTALFSKIIFNKPKKSVTSLKENEATIKELNLKLIDLPGADRLRDRCWEQYRAKARHVIFVLDSTTIENKIRDVAEYLYVLLSDMTLYKNSIQFTIACNKQDIDCALKTGLVKNLLEVELNAILGTKAGQLSKTSNEEEEEDYLLKLKETGGKEITLTMLNVNLIETSVHNLEQLIKIII